VSFEPHGSIEAASSWLGLVLGERDFEAAWLLTDAGLRLAIAQGWLFDREEQSDELAASLASAPSSSILWPAFETDVLDALKEKWSFFDFDGEWGVLGEPQPFPSQGLEVVHFLMTEGAPPGPIKVEAETDWASLPLLMRTTDEGWRVAGFSQAGPPTPGWPPIWPVGPKLEF
jgi:hypothetical protein